MSARIQLWIGYRLPDNPDMELDARFLEADALTMRNMEIQSCARGINPSRCEQDAEIAFRRRIAAIPGARFILQYSVQNVDKDNQTQWLMDLTADEAMNKHLNQEYNPLQSASVVSLGIYVDLGECLFVSSQDDQPIAYHEDFVKYVCKMAGQRNDATELLSNLLRGEKHPDVGEVVFLLDHGADIDERINDGQTALMFAASRGHLDATRLLLDRGVDFDPKDRVLTP